MNRRSTLARKTRQTGTSRHSRPRASILLLGFLLLVPALAPGQEPESGPEPPASTVCPQPPASLIVLRHACKATRCPASPLNDIGHEQARDLAMDLADQGVDAIFVTTSERTQQTAAVLAERIGQPVACQAADVSRRCVQEEPYGIDELIAEICSGRYAGQTVVHIGHFNTLPRLFERLGLKGPRSFPSAKPWKIIFGEDGTLSFEELPLEYTSPLGAKACGTIGCDAQASEG
jgi:phosphohistidine phosphatase SixA